MVASVTAATTEMAERHLRQPETTPRRANLLGQVVVETLAEIEAIEPDPGVMSSGAAQAGGRPGATSRYRTVTGGDSP